MGAAWQDAKAGSAEWKAFERIAIVSDHTHLLGMIHFFSGLFPGEARTYPMAQLADATAWLGEAPS